MNAPLAVLVGLLLCLLTLASYVDRLYSEMGKFLSREFQENIDSWEGRIEPRLSLSRDQLALSAAVLAQLSLAALALVFGALLFAGAPVPRHPSAGECAQAVLGSVLVIVIFNRLLPYLFFARTRGEWLVPFVWLLRLIFFAFLPVTLLISFLLSIVALSNPAPPKKEEEEAAAAVDALIEAGQEEGILEEGDQDLIRSAVEFSDKLVREVMTPRPSIFAVAAETTLQEFLRLLEQNSFSRVPVYSGSLDQIHGIVFAHDLLQVTDVEAETRRVGSLARPASFVPETKKAKELLREMQREKQHMRIVIDEYGGVAGLVTIEDLLEEIVGSIDDEHDDVVDGELVVEQVDEDGKRTWLVPGSLELSRLQSLLGGEWHAPEDYEATTVGGLVSESLGRIPMPGEVAEELGLRFEILASTDRRIERLRLGLVHTPSAVSSLGEEE